MAAKSDRATDGGEQLEVSLITDARLDRLNEMVKNAFEAGYRAGYRAGVEAAKLGEQ